MPSKTRGEALYVNRQAEVDGWSRVIVITAEYHVTRSRFIFDRCAGVPANVIAVRAPLSPLGWVYQYAYQTAGFAKALVVGCVGPG